ncbi:MAG: hypothetical protein GTO54_00040 [Nitrososphaeria archaeon]|nr:hypothetical protein [Nitrososphaeria archaeon]
MSNFGFKPVGEEPEKKEEAPQAGGFQPVAQPRYSSPPKQDTMGFTPVEPKPGPGPQDAPAMEVSEDHEITDRDLNLATTGLKVRPRVLADTRKLVPFFGGRVKGEDAPLSQRVLGFLGDSLAFGLPQKAFIETQAAEPRGIAKYWKSWKELTEGKESVDNLTEDEIKYVDRIRQMAVAKKGWGQWLLEAGAGLVVPGGLAAKAGAGAKFSTKAAISAAEGAAVGGTAGLGYSPHGEELESTAIGAGIGAAAGGTLQTLGSALGFIVKGGDDATTNALKKQMERLDVTGKADELDKEYRVLTKDFAKMEEAAIGAGAQLEPEYMHKVDKANKALIELIKEPVESVEIAGFYRAKDRVENLRNANARGRVKAYELYSYMPELFSKSYRREVYDGHIPKDLHGHKKLALYFRKRAEFMDAIGQGDPTQFTTKNNKTMRKLVDDNDIAGVAEEFKHPELNMFHRPSIVYESVWTYDNIYKTMPKQLKADLKARLKGMKVEESGQYLDPELVERVIKHADNMHRRKLMVRAAREELVREGKELPGIGGGVKLFKLLSDGKPIQMFIDNRYGTRMSRIIDEMDKKTILMKNLGNELVEDINALKSRDMFSGNINDKPTPEMKVFYKKVFDIFTDKDTVNLRIHNYGEDFVPHTFKDPKRLFLDVIDRSKEVINHAGGVAKLREMNAIDFDSFLKRNAAAKELVDSITLINRKAMKKGDGGEGLYQALRDLKERPTDFRARAESKARTELERKGKIPNLLLEQDPYKATVKYIHNSLKHAAVKDYLPRLADIRDVAVEARDPVVAGYVNDLITDILGTRTKGNRLYTLGKEMAEGWEKRYLNKASEATRPKAREYNIMMAEVPGMLKAINSYVYPSFIGFSPRAVFQNSISPFYMNIGGMGPRYGSKLATKALGDTMKVIGSREGMEAMAERLGMVEKEFRGELSDALETGLAESALFKANDKVVKWWSKSAMWLFSKSEKFARIQNYHMAKRVADDVIRSVKGGVNNSDTRAAMQFLNDIPDRAYREEMQALVRRMSTGKLRGGEERKLTEYMTEYLNAQSMFNYTRANMSEFGRTMGPIFSVFTKWPTSMYGKAFQQLHDEGKLSGGARLARFFLYPLVAAQIADASLGDLKDEPLYKTVVGKQGMAGATPASALVGMTKGEFLAPPVLQALEGMGTGVPLIAKGVVTADGKPIRKGVRKIEQSMNGYVPLYNLYPFFNEKVPGILNMEPIGPRRISDALLGD